MSKGDKKNIMNRRKPKSVQKENLTEVDGRDTFQTPNYATDLLVPYLLGNGVRVWEPAAGLGKIVSRLRYHGFKVMGTDLAEYGEWDNSFNFVTDNMVFSGEIDMIVTNPPFSLKEKFYRKCLEYKIPFGLLIPADYSGWTIEAVQHGAEKIIPTRRIDYITPNILNRIHEGELWANSKEFYEGKNLAEFKENNPIEWESILNTYPGYCKWDTIYEAPAKLLRKYSSSYYHSMWLTWGFEIGRTETFVELTSEMKNNI